MARAVTATLAGASGPRRRGEREGGREGEGDVLRQFRSSNFAARYFMVVAKDVENLQTSSSATHHIYHRTSIGSDPAQVKSTQAMLT